MVRIFNILLLTTVFVEFAFALKVLVSYPFPGKSHTILGEGYVRTLLKAGHNVTYITPVPMKIDTPNLRQIDVSSNTKFLGEFLNVDKILNKEVDLSDDSLKWMYMHMMAEKAIKHENVQKLLLDTSEEFDIAVVEWMYSELYSGIAAVFNCPYIWSSSMEPHPMVLRLIDEITNPAYIPDHKNPIEPPLTFFQRVVELWHLIKIFYIRWTYSNTERTLWTEAFEPAFLKRGRKLPSMEEVMYNASMMLGNSHVSSGIAVRLPQNYIPISGYHIEKETPALPENLQRLMDSATHGVIYFSLGTIMKGSTMPEVLKSGFLRTFGGLKQVVIWKLEQELQNVPSNVHIVKWAPQQSILAHPNIVLFITHGGLLSTTETLHFGVPIIGIPLFDDQFINIKKAVTQGFAEKVDLDHDTPAKLKTAIEKVLGNPRYRQKVKEISFIYHDRPVPPAKELVHWVEHVAKSRGALHLRSPALMLPWYQKAYLDLIALLSLCFYITVRVAVRLLRTVNKKKKCD